jgi:uncharacterized peroxidase-related enzyme
VHHAASFRRTARNDELADQVQADWTTAALPPEDRALADYAADLTRRPNGDGAARVAVLREAGFSDEAILRATEVTAYFNFINRMASGLGVELEPEYR